MAIKMSFTSKDGRVSPDAYWALVDVNANFRRGVGKLVFAVWHDQALAAAKADHINYVKVYVINEVDYNTWFAPDVLTPDGENHIKAAYEYAAATKDTLKEGYTSELNGLVFRNSQGDIVDKSEATESFFETGITV